VADRPNILFFHVDNLGFGELSCYSGGPFRGTWTRRIDAFAGRGLRLTNYAPEVQCTPTRSALLTGRHAIRSGNHSVPLGASGGWGLVAWEKTLGDLLTEVGYSCAVYGKWHVGEGSGRWPTDHGFAEWYGIGGRSPARQAEHRAGRRAGHPLDVLAPLDRDLPARLHLPRGRRGDATPARCQLTPRRRADPDHRPGAAAAAALHRHPAAPARPGPPTALAGLAAPPPARARQAHQRWNAYADATP
jgi:arylsulfatase A-like enzyme